LPEPVAEDHHVRALVIRYERSAEHRHGAEQSGQLGRYHAAKGLLRLGSGAQVVEVRRPHGGPIERVHRRPQVFVVGQRQPRDDQAIRIHVGQRLQQDGVHDAEDRRRRADAE
jgi:hypothetical protein